MIFNKTGKLIRCNFKYKNMNINTVREYKYLGFMITPSGEITTGLKDLKNRALRAVNILRSKMGEYFRNDVTTTLKLFNAMIRPILLYMSDFWGNLKMPLNNPIEVCHMKFLKQLLGVQVQTTNIRVLLETGEIPISIEAKKISLKNWERIRSKKCNPLLQISYDNALQENLVWLNRIKEELSSIGLGNLYESGDGGIAEEFLQRQTDIFHQNAFAGINRENSKLRTYSTLKTEIGKEKYLTEIHNIKNRIALTKIRLSNHTLMIEKGRHLNIHKTKRICNFCPNVEDEFHFVIECKTYSAIRSQL